MAENAITFTIFSYSQTILDKRLHSLKFWLEKELGLPLTSIEVASADASFRRYFRITIKRNSSQFDYLPETMIAMDSPPEHEDNALFIHCTNILKHCKLNVPNIYFQNLASGFLLIKDLGVRTYDQVLNKSNADKLYSGATSALLKMQKNADHSAAPSYDAEKLQNEMSLFEDWYIAQHHNARLDQAQQNKLHRIYSVLIDNAREQDQVLVHRDYHCRNLLLTEETVGIIDYQDMVYGPITYDIVSLFKDCYIEWPTERVQQWSLSFQKSALDAGLTTEKSPQQWLQWFDLMGVQRHLKILGIFCRLYYRDGKQQYMSDLDLTYRYLLQTCEKYQSLEDLVDLLNRFPVSNTNT